MFQRKNASNLERKMVVEVKIVIAYVNVVDINVVTRKRIAEDQMFQEKEPRKNKSTTDWEKEEKLKKTMAEKIQ